MRREVDEEWKKKPVELKLLHGSQLESPLVSVGANLSASEK